LEKLSGVDNGLAKGSTLISSTNNPKAFMEGKADVRKLLFLCLKPPRGRHSSIIRQNFIQQRV